MQTLNQQPARFDTSHAVPVPVPAATKTLTSAQQDALRTLGFLYLQTGKKDKALILFEALHRLLPHDHPIALSLAYSRLASAEYEAALAIAEPLSTELIEDLLTAPLHLLCARALLGLAKPAEAHEHLLRYQDAIGNPP